MLKKSIPAFVEKTWSLLESGQFAEVICWNQQGDAFRIVNDHQFQHTVLPAYFKHSNLTSFQRQLNMYNFHKRKLENGQTEYHHRLFRMHQKELLTAIRRKPSEDQIEIGEELLRKLALEHEETHPDNQPPKDRIEPPCPPSYYKAASEGCQMSNPESPKASDQPQQAFNFQTQFISYNLNTQISLPYTYYYIPNPYPMPLALPMPMGEVVGWCPQKKIKTYVVVQSPEQGQHIYCTPMM